MILFFLILAIRLISNNNIILSMLITKIWEHSDITKMSEKRGQNK